MNRWPSGIDAAYLRYEHEQRLKRVLEFDVRYGDCSDSSTPVPVEHVGGSWSPAQHARKEGTK